MIKLELTEQEAQALAGIMDAGVRHLGLRAVKDTAVLLVKLEAAMPTPEKEENDG